MTRIANTIRPTLMASSPKFASQKAELSTEVKSTTASSKGSSVDKASTIMVTGAAGYIGSHFAWDLLSHSDYKVLAVDDQSSGEADAISTLKKAFPGRVKYFKGKVSDSRLATLMKTFKVKAVVHYAGKISVGESEKDPIKYWDGNTAETIKLLSSMKEADVRNFVFSSTAAVYGMPEEVPIAEEAPKKPINSYGRSKLAVENVLEDLHSHTDETGRPLLNYVALRYFNVIGAHPDRLLGENQCG